MSVDISLDGWDIVRASEADWIPWTGAAGEARAKILGSADGYTVVLVEAQPGYRGDRHVHGTRSSTTWSRERSGTRARR